MTITPEIRKTLLEGLNCLEENLSYEDFDHLDEVQAIEDEDELDIKIEELRYKQAEAIEAATKVLNA